MARGHPKETDKWLLFDPCYQYMWHSKDKEGVATLSLMGEQLAQEHPVNFMAELRSELWSPWPSPARQPLALLRGDKDLASPFTLTLNFEANFMT